MSKTANKSTGQIGEDLAADYLKKQGYRILKSNFHTRFGEIDLICEIKKNKVPNLVFVEVKTKTGHAFGEPWEMVTPAKLAQVKRMAHVYLSQTGQPNASCRLDVIGINLTPDGAVENISHYEAVY